MVPGRFPHPLQTPSPRPPRSAHGRFPRWWHAFFHPAMNTPQTRLPSRVDCRPDGNLAQMPHTAPGHAPEARLWILLWFRGDRSPMSLREKRGPPEGHSRGRRWSRDRGINSDPPFVASQVWTRAHALKKARGTRTPGAQFRPTSAWRLWANGPTHPRSWQRAEAELRKSGL